MHRKGFVSALTLLAVAAVIIAAFWYLNSGYFKLSKPSLTPQAISTTTSTNKKPGTEPTYLTIVNARRFLVTDPQGRRAGTDIATGNIFDDIPGAEYWFEQGIANAEDPSAQGLPSVWKFEFPEPPSGSYKVIVFGDEKSTYSNLETSSANREGIYSRTQHATRLLPGDVKEYIVKYSSSGKTAVEQIAN